MRLVLFRQPKQVVLRFLCLGFAAITLACSPKFDWRTIQNQSLAYSALFPGKPKLVERTLTYQESTLKQSLEFVKVDEDVFAVMSTEIPAALVAQVQAIEGLLKTALLQQAASLNQSTPPSFSLTKESSIRIGSGQAKQGTHDYYLDLPQDKRATRVRWILRPMVNGGLYLYQVSVIRAQSESNPKISLEAYLNHENINTFFDEFRPN